MKLAHEVTPKKPWLLQRLEVSSDLTRSGRSLDTRKVKPVFGEVPEIRGAELCSNNEAYKTQRSKAFGYDGMGAAEFEFGALYHANWNWSRNAVLGNIVVEHHVVHEGWSSEQEDFWIMCPASTLEITRATINEICRSTCYERATYGMFKEALYFDQELFPRSKLSATKSYASHTDAILNKTYDYCGWFDLGNASYVFWNRRDIADYYTKMWGLPSVIGATKKVYDIKDLKPNNLNIMRNP